MRAAKHRIDLEKRDLLTASIRNLERQRLIVHRIRSIRNISFGVSLSALGIALACPFVLRNADNPFRQRWTFEFTWWLAAAMMVSFYIAARRLRAAASAGLHEYGRAYIRMLRRSIIFDALFVALAVSELIYEFRIGPPIRHWINTLSSHFPVNDLVVQGAIGGAVGNASWWLVTRLIDNVHSQSAGQADQVDRENGGAEQ